MRRGTLPFPIRPRVLAAGLLTFLIAASACAGAIGPLSSGELPQACGSERAMDAVCLRWTRHHGGATYDEATAIALSPDGNRTFVVGDSHGAQSSALLVAYDAASGATLWTQSHQGTGGHATARDVAVSPDGTRVYAAIGSYNLGTLTDFGLFAYDAATGALLWSDLWNGAFDSYDLPAEIVVSQDGSRVYAAGSTHTGPSAYAFVTAAYDTASGTRDWVQVHPRAAGRTLEYGHGVAVTPDGARVLATGVSYTGVSGHREALVLAYHANGTLAWEDLYAGGWDVDEGRDVKVSPDGARAYVTGHSAQPTSWGDVGEGFFLLAYDVATGALDWEARDADPSTTGNGEEVGVSPDGTRVFTTGRMWLDWTWAVRAFNASDGAPRWTLEYTSGGLGGESFHLAVAPDGQRVYASGIGFGSGTSYDHVTLAVRASDGHLEWAARHQTSSMEESAGVVVSPDGRDVYVAGESPGGAGASQEMLTVAYRNVQPLLPPVS